MAKCNQLTLMPFKGLTPTSKHVARNSATAEIAWIVPHKPHIADSYMYILRVKTCHSTFVHNFDNVNRFSKFFHSQNQQKLQQNCGNISHHTLDVSRHYLAKFKCLHIVIFDYSGHKHLASKSDLFLLKLISI